MSEPEQIKELLARIEENLPKMSADVRQGWIDNPEALRRYLSGLSPLEDTPDAVSAFKVWRTITHRGRRNVESYRASLSSTECKISDPANDILGRFETTSVDEEVDLGCAFVSDLGFKEATRLDVICDRIVSIGYNLCLPEDGPVLREQYLHQPEYEWVRMAMKAISNSRGYLDIFGIGYRGRGLWLDRHNGSSDTLFYPEDQFIFRLCKRPLVA